MKDFKKKLADIPSLQDEELFTVDRIESILESLKLTKKELRNIDKHILRGDVTDDHGYNFTKEDVYNHVRLALTSDNNKRNSKLFLKVLGFISIY